MDDSRSAQIPMDKTSLSKKAHVFQKQRKCIKKCSEHVNLVMGE